MAIPARAVKHFWAKVILGKSEQDCWNWSGELSVTGYGRIDVQINKKRQFYFAHRLSLIIHSGVESDLLVLHSCHNPSCCNPLHLRYGTANENTQDMINAGRANFKGSKGRQFLNSRNQLH